MTRITVNICYRRHGREYFIFLGTENLSFCKIYDWLFLGILTDQQKATIELNKHRECTATPLMRLLNNQYLELIKLAVPVYDNIKTYEDAMKKAQKLQQLTSKIGN